MEAFDVKMAAKCHSHAVKKQTLATDDLMRISVLPKDLFMIDTSSLYFSAGFCMHCNPGLV